MANPVFENAIAMIRHAVESVETELVKAQGAHQHLDALRVQQRDLQKIVNDLAAQVPIAKHVIAQSEDQAKSIIESAKQQHRHIVDNAHKQAEMIVKSANSNADEIIANAHVEIADESKAIEDLREKKRIELGQLESIQRKVDATTSQFAAMRRQHAAAMAALE